MNKEIMWPKTIFGTSGLGNLYEAVPFEQKRDIVKACLTHAEKPVCFDSAGKYGAGLALESLGRALNELAVNPSDILISNKLGWLRTELKTPEARCNPKDKLQRHTGMLRSGQSFTKRLQGRIGVGA